MIAFRRISRPRAEASKARASWIIGAPLIALFVALRIWDPAALELVRLKTFDLYQMAKPRATEELPVVVVDIDERSLREVGQWPWPRTRVAELVEKLTAFGAPAIALDIVFAEPDQLSPALMIENLPSADPDLAQFFSDLPSNDEVLAGALERSKVVLGQAGFRDDAKIDIGGPLTSIALSGQDPRPFLVQFPDLLRNLPVLESSAAGRGLISIRPEVDGVVRRIPVVLEAGGEVAPALALDLLRVANGATTILVRADAAGIESVLVGDVLVPTSLDGQTWVYYSESDKSRYVSAVDVLTGAVDAAKIKDRLVFVGTSAIGLFDLRATPLHGALPGVEIHAQMLETILTGQQLVRPGPALGAEIVIAVAVGLVIVMLVPKLGAFSVLALGLAIATALGYVSWHLFAEHRVLLDVAYPMFSCFTVWSALTFYNYAVEERERNWVRGAFGRYLAPDVVERLADDPAGLSLGGETRTLSILFTDVRGFTGISEAYRDDPQGLTRLMNSFLTPLSNAIVERSGTIDKYMGDAIMAFWNAPLDVADHPQKACEAALEMRRRLDVLNAKRRAEAHARGAAPPLAIDIGVGVNTGECVVGNMGSELRFDYSALGDAVNLASRIEGLTKQYGVSALIGSATAAQAGEAVAAIPIDRLRVKGKQEPEEIYVLLGDAALAQEQSFKALKHAIAEILVRYRAMDWHGAIHAIEMAKLLDGADELQGLFANFLERIADLRINPPPPGWDGVYDAKSK